MSDDDLKHGPLPEGWKRTEEARAMERYRWEDGRFYRPDGTEIDISTWPRRTVITGPWQGGDDD